MTLLELLLTLALTAMVITLLGIAMDFHLNVVDIKRTEVEQTQLARAVLRMMADDIRATIRSTPVDFSSVADLAGASDFAGASDLAGLDLGAIDESLADIDPDALGTSATQGVAESVEPPSVPGLYGNRYELRLDVSRLPRPDQYWVNLATDAGATDIPSEVKSVAYYVQTDAVTGGSRSNVSSDGPAEAVAPASAEGETQGLIRRSLSRAASEWASENGDLDLLSRSTQVIAPEVLHLEFRYFDGTEWLDEWDTEQEGGLPVAVEIEIWITSPDETDTSQTRSVEPLAVTDEASDTSEIAGRVYHLIVDLPAAEPTTDEDEADAASAEEVMP